MIINLVLLLAVQQPLERQLYQALIAAASGAIRLNETAAAHRWLDAAPRAHRGWEWDYLNRLARQSAAGINAHDAAITGISASDDGRLLATASGDKSVKLWDASTGKSTHTLAGGTGEIYAAQFSPDSRLLAAGWTGGQAKVIDRETGADAAVLDGHPGGVYSLAFHPSGNLLATGGADRMIRIWSVPDGKLLRTLSGHTELVYGLDYSPDGLRIVSCSNDMTVRFRTDGSSDPLLSIPFPVQVYGVKFSPNGQTLATLPMDGSIRLLSATR